ncbi:hypothetical protein LCGC14_1379010 [marine sediment metagenome]|uniref:Uncharacterized protein n=1 Tax=marine sediment metagenome TaxID=412755 RepID=A0A0F9N4W5_9ZZZZ
MAPETATSASCRTCPTIELVDPNDLIPSEVNEKVYRPVDPNDPGIKKLAKDIEKNGILEPLVISSDNRVLSGNRRQAGAIIAGLSVVPVRRENISSDDPEFLKMLVSYNSQRVKSRPELLREVVIQTDSDEAYEALLEYRKQEASIAVDTMNVKNRSDRRGISDRKSDMVRAVIDVVYDNEDYWPLSDRGIHYGLLNAPPLRNTKRRGSRYKNDLKSYKDACDLLVRMRLNGEIPMNCIEDSTRPTVEWNVHANPQDFARGEIDGLLKGFRRDLQQSQAVHLEIIAEKLTVQNIIRPICGKYNIPYTIGRGYCSLPARYKIVERFRRSGKDKLVLIILGDLDCEGVDIGECLLQSVRQDFGVYNAEAVRAALNPEHVKKLKHNAQDAKSGSSRYANFVKRYGKKAFELEAVSPKRLQEILSETIDSLLDTAAFNAELEAEKEDAAFLAGLREMIQEGALEALEDYDD